MERKSINPWDWGLKWSMDQGELVEGITRYLHFSGQVAVEPAPDTGWGIKVISPFDIRGQMEAALDNVDEVLKKAGMTRKNILTLRFYTTDVDGFLENYDIYTQWIDPIGIRPPQSLIGVSRLVIPELKVEIEVTAGA